MIYNIFWPSPGLPGIYPVTVNVFCVVVLASAAVNICGVPIGPYSSSKIKYLSSVSSGSKSKFSIVSGTLSPVGKKPPKPAGQLGFGANIELP